jgi:hypothetical protein
MVIKTFELTVLQGLIPGFKKGNPVF